MLAAGLIFYNRLYSSFTLIFTAIFTGLIFILKKYFSSFNTAAFLISYVIILIPFLLVNGLLTALPVVVYNNAENMGVRIYHIPVEDIFYGYLLFMMNVAVYEKIKESRVKTF